MKLIKRILPATLSLLFIPTISNAIEIADFNLQYKAFNTYCASGKDNLNIMSDLIADNWIKDVNSKKIDNEEYKKLFSEYYHYINYGKTTIFTKKINNKPMFIFVDEKNSLCGLSPIMTNTKENLSKEIENTKDIKLINTNNSNGVITNSYLYDKNIISVIKIPDKDKDNIILNVYSTTIDNLINK